MFGEQKSKIACLFNIYNSYVTLFIVNRNLLLPFALLLIRLYVGWVWLEAGFAKITSSVWVGNKAGVAISGFLNGALAKTAGEHPDVQWWYAEFIKNIALPNKVLFSYMVSFGEFAVGLGLILGALTSYAAFFGALMNFNYLLSGVVSVNPILLLCEIIILFFRKQASQVGVDRYLMPQLKKFFNPKK